MKVLIQMHYGSMTILELHFNYSDSIGLIVADHFKVPFVRL